MSSTTSEAPASVEGGQQPGSQQQQQQRPRRRASGASAASTTGTGTGTVSTGNLNDDLTVVEDDRVLAHIKFEHRIEQSLKHSQREAHAKRMQSLRKELDYLAATAWQFE